VAIYSLICPNKCLLNLAILLSNSRCFGVGARAAVRACRAETLPLSMNFFCWVNFVSKVSDTFLLAVRDIFSIGILGNLGFIIFIYHISRRVILASKSVTLYILIREAQYDIHQITPNPSLSFYMVSERHAP
jgi:hypothetical protein